MPGSRSLLSQTCDIVQHVSGMRMRCELFLMHNSIDGLFILIE